MKSTMGKDGCARVTLTLLHREARVKGRVTAVSVGHLPEASERFVCQLS